MRNLYSKYKQFFCVPADGKVSEKTMMRRIALSIAVAVICMGAMSISAYAFVTWNVTSGVNVIKSAHFVEKVAPLTRATADEDGIYKLAEGEHSFTLGHDGDATTGYYKILIDDERSALLNYDSDNGGDVKWTYYSKQIMQEDKEQRTVTIIVPEGATAYVEFVAEWGTYSGDDAVSTIDLTDKEFENVEEEVQEEQTSGEQSKAETQVTESEQSGDSGDQQETQATESTEPAQPDQPADNTEQEQQTEPTEPTDATEPTDGETTDATEDKTNQENDQAITPTE